MLKYFLFLCVTLLLMQEFHCKPEAKKGKEVPFCNALICEIQYEHHDEHHFDGEKQGKFGIKLMFSAMKDKTIHV